MTILADSNARNKLWYDTITNERGKKLEEFITINSLHIVNENIGVPTFETVNGRSWVDLTVVNNKLLRDIREWTTGEEESCSDHKIISFRIGNVNQNHTRTFKGTRFITNANKNKQFNNHLVESLKLNFNCKSSGEKMDEELAQKANAYTNVESLIETFYSSMHDACSRAYGVSRGKKLEVRGKSVPWWTPELTILRKRVNALRRRYQRTINNEQLRDERRNQYLEGNRQYRASINDTKLESWKKFCNATDGNNPWTALYKIAAGKLRGQSSLTTLQKEDGSYTEDTTSTLEYMMENFVPEDSEQYDTERHKELRRLTTEPMDTPDDMEFTTAEILAVLKNFNSKKSPGEDGITSDILLNAFRVFPRFFTTLYNKCLKSGTFPERWKRSVIVPIIKPGKEGSESVTKYRPISLLNISGKVLEKLMINRIEHHINSRNLLNTRQFGFRAQKSTVDAALAMKTFTENNLHSPGYIALISLDVKGAFDAAWWPSILNNLRELECPKNLYRLSKDYFNNRKASLSTNECQIEKQVMRGCPQGSCCGPVYWNILYNSLLNLDFTQRTEVIAFADDLLIMTKGKSILDVENFANQDLTKIESWAKANKIKFNESKSKVLVITRKKKPNNEMINIYLNNKSLEQVEILKYLGIYIDNKLKFDYHIDKVHDKALRLIHTLSKSAKLTWGLGNKALETIYRGAIEPILTYAAPVWGTALRKQRNLKKIQRIQRLFNIKVAKAYRTISYDASCVIAGIQPIDITIQGKIKLFNFMHEDIDYDAPLPPSDWIHPAESPHIKETEEDADYAIKIYTDGSKTRENVGAAAVIFQNNTLIRQLKYRLDGKCSNNQAEQLAILKALQELHNISDIPNEEKTAAIYSDSKVTLAILQNNKKHNSIAETTLKTLTTLERKQWRIKFSWVKAHVGIAGNELADKLAKAASEDDGIQSIYNKVPKSTIITLIQETGHQEWQNRWNSTDKGTVSKSFFPSIKERIKKKLPITPIFTAMVSGHGKTNVYLYRFHIIDDPKCTCNNPQQTVNHLIYECRDTRQQRSVLIDDIRRNGGNWPVTNQQLINQHMRAFCKYIHSIKL